METEALGWIGVPLAVLSGAIRVGTPFLYVSLQGKLTLYATKSCTEQLRKAHGVSVTALDTKLVGDIYIATCHVRDRDGREDVATGAVPIILGGDHSITWPSASAVAQARAPKKIGIVHFDAHADTANDDWGVLAGHGAPMRALMRSDSEKPWAPGVFASSVSS